MSIPDTFMEPEQIIDRLGLKPWPEKAAEQVKVNAAMGSYHAKDMGLRMTGRSTRMMVQALSVASSGLPVRIRAGSNGLEAVLTKNLKALAARAGVSQRMIRSSTGIGVIEFYDHSFYTVMS